MLSIKKSFFQILFLGSGKQRPCQFAFSLLVSLADGSVCQLSVGGD